MSVIVLKAQSIGSIRRFVSRFTSRDGLKELLLEAGANADRVLNLTVTNQTRSSAYLSMAELLNQGFDTIYQDFDKPEADGIVIRMIGLLLVRGKGSQFLEVLPELEQGLSFSGLTIAQVQQATTATTALETASQQAQAAQLTEATELIAKGLRRLTTDRPGAITACTAAAESACRIVLERFNLPLPAGKTLPDYLQTICQQTNIEALARVGGEDTRRIFGSLRGLTQSLYQAAHQHGDRHAHGQDAVEPSPFTADLLVSACAALTTVIAGTLARGELQATHLHTPTT
jgi:hypothetical protein